MIRALPKQACWSSAGGRRENSPAIYRWGFDQAISNQSAKRTAENRFALRLRLKAEPESWRKPSISVVRFTDLFVRLDLIPALKVLGYSHLVRSRTRPIRSFWAKPNDSLNAPVC
jgi:hypothetical protein